MACFIGTSGWSYARWQPAFYPAGLPSSRWLAFYAARLSAVEVNYTFCGQRQLSMPAAAHWLAATPPAFLFAFRAPKPITHFHRYRLQHADELVTTFLDTLAPFRRADRLGPILFQLPATFLCDLPVLAEFLMHWSSDLRIAFEFRHPSRWHELTYKLLRRHNAALCWAERDEQFTAHVRTADFVYLRLRRSHYTRHDLSTLAAHLTPLKHTSIFAFFRQDTANAPAHAQSLLAQLAAARHAA